MKQSSNTTVSQSVALTGKDVVELLVSAGIIPEELIEDKVSIHVNFKVPTGGDYSGMDVDFDKEERLVVSWTSHKIETK